MIRSAGCGGFGKSPNVPEMRRHIPGSSVCTIFAGKCNEKTMRYDCLFFDLDRTLWDVDRNQKKALRVLYGRYGLDRSGIGFERCFAVFERINAGLWDDYRDGKISRETLRDTRFERMLDEIGLSDRALAQTLADDYLKLAPTFRGLIPYAREVVRELSERYPMYIVTNGFAGVQQIKLRHSGLDGYFRGVVCSEDAGANKPDPRIFEYALDLAGVKAGAAVMIGDDPYSDIPGAERAGIDSIWFDPSGMPCECRPTYRIGSQGAAGVVVGSGFPSGRPAESSCLASRKPSPDIHNGRFFRSGAAGRTNAGPGSSAVSAVPDRSCCRPRAGFSFPVSGLIVRRRYAPQVGNRADTAAGRVRPSAARRVGFVGNAVPS